MPFPAARFIAFLFVWAVPATIAVEVRIQAGSIDFPPWNGENIAVHVSWREDGRMDIQIEAPRLGRAGRPLLPPLRLTCQGLFLGAEFIDCPHGVIEGLHPPRTHGQWKGRWDGQAWRLQWQLQALELAQLLRWGGPLNAGLQEFTDASGTLDLQAELAGTAEELTHIRTRGTGYRMNFNGPSAAEDAGGSFQLAAKKKGNVWEIEGDLRLTAGQIYVEPGVSIQDVPLGFALSAPEEGLSLKTKARWHEDDGHWDIDSVRFQHPQVADLALSGSFHLGGKASFSGKVQAKLPHLGTAFAPYLQPFLLAAGLGGLETAGAMEAMARFQENRLTDLQLGFQGVTVDDPEERFRVSALAGKVAVNSGAGLVHSWLRWAGGGLYRLNIGAGGVALASQKGDLWLDGKARLPILGGGLEIESLRLDGIGRDDFSMRLDARLMPFSLVEFTHAMGWPAMSGTVSGVIPGVLYQQGMLRVGGSLLIEAFDGRIVVQDLQIDGLFGLVPTLDANILFKELDLESLTRTFAFGKIEGRLNGQMRRLRLEDWQPAYFEAEFATTEEDDKPHRISQRAVENLTRVGGGMTVSALSGALLRMFDEFSYDRLGLKCHLHEGVCDMDGIEPVDGGYYIVTRGLLPPWIDVKGFNRRVDWDVLVERLKGVTQSEGPIVE